MEIPNQGIDVEVIDQRLTIIIMREFDLGIKRDQWSLAVTKLFSDVTYNAVVVDLGRCPVISSTVIAGIVHLHDHYWKTCPDGVILRHASKHVQKVLEMMRLSSLFFYEDAEKQ